MRRGFTLIEIIFVIIIVGILSSILVPRFTRPTLIEAANQVVSHIQYTQHLAMIDNKFDPKDSNWYKDRWQIQFGHTNGSDDQWAYTIFSDHDGNSTGVAGISEIARNILNPQLQYMTGGYTDGVLPYKVSGSINPRITKNMNIGHKYNISPIKLGPSLNRGISFSGGCNNVSTRISFDHIGRPLFGTLASLTTQYTISSGTSKLLQSPCDIRLLNSDNNSITIRIEPETGYTHII